MIDKNDIQYTQRPHKTIIHIQTELKIVLFSTFWAYYLNKNLTMMNHIFWIMMKYNCVDK